MARFDWEPIEAYKTIYGLPLTYRPHDQTYLIGGRGGKVITAQALEALMGDRPYQKLTGSELARVLGEQLSGAKPAPIDATVFGDTNRTFLAGPVTSSAANVETVFRVGADGRPEAVTRLVDKPSSSAVRNAGESELAWLKRRVNEICWRPS